MAGDTLVKLSAFDFPGWEADNEGNVYLHGAEVDGHAQDSGHVLLGHYKIRRARIVCNAWHGPSPTDKPFALHKNDYGWDDTPGNLYWGSDSDNRKDAWRNGQIAACGEKASGSKLTEQEVIEIRIKHASGAYSQRYLANIYQVSNVTINHIVHRITWRHI